MQDITARGKGDSLLRKIDFRYDHFAATYGPKGDGLNKALVPALYAPSISRRIEQIVTPVTPFPIRRLKAPQHFMDLAPLLRSTVTIHAKAHTSSLLTTRLIRVIRIPATARFKLTVE